MLCDISRHYMPSVEESGGGVLVTIQRKTIEDIIASRGKSGAVNNVDVNNENSGLNNERGAVNNMVIMNFSKRQIIIKEIINQNPMITAKQMSETLLVRKRTI